MICKGRACALHLTREYADGNIAGFTGEPYANPYNFWNEYEEHYSWDIGYQKGKSDA
jgi:hypothetical protein